MNQDNCDERTPIGQIIKRINALCKKPQLDDQLSGALDTFREIVLQEQQYLSNGIFHTNFGEAALFLQSCSELYGKKVDLLWDQLLTFHTRLIEYDCEHEKQKGAKVNQDVIDQLEERRNRYKRKKKFKLMVTQDDKTESFLFDKNVNAEPSTTFEPDEDLHRSWRRLEYRSDKMRKIPIIVYKQQMKMYRMKNYKILKCQDFDVEDVLDGEFSTRYSRIPGWHHLLHLFEYNNEGLLPDNNNTIARLRLCMYKRLHFLRDRNIPLNAPFSQYKEEYLKFREEFFLEESKKWQNMPLDTLEDLHKQLEYLAEKEREANMNNLNHNIHRITPIPKLISKDEIIYCSDSSSDVSKDGDVEIVAEATDKRTELLDDNRVLDLNVGCNDTSTSDLVVRLEKMSTDTIDSKLRQDSGFYDEENEENDDSTKDHETDDVVGTESENVMSAENNTSLENCVNPNEAISNITNNDLTSAEKNGDIESATPPEQITENNDQNNPFIATAETIGYIEASTIVEENSGLNGTPVTVEDKGVNIGTSNSENIAVQSNLEDKENHMSVDDDNFDTRSIMSDHDYCRSPLTVSNLQVNRQETNIAKENSNTPTQQMMAPFSARCRIIPRPLKMKEKRVKLAEENDGCSLPKRRKLSKKQLEKLFKSLVPPTKEQKFEKFFSLNYQPQIGEGDILPVDYESEQSDEENVNELPIQNEPMEDEGISQENDDTQSIFSEHSYCQPPDEEDPEALHDSGIVDVPPLLQNNNNMATEENIESGLTQAESTVQPESTAQLEIADKNARTAKEVAEEEEYQRLLAALRESRRELNEEIDDPQALNTERVVKEKQRREMRERVEEWKQNIMPILRSLKEQDFDIHEYGSKIMDNMEVNEVKPFREMVKGKPSTEVVRYFISTLQLANTYNVEINGVAPGGISNESFALRLLKRDRYHEHLTEYEAPSTETFRERIKRMRENTKIQFSDSDEEPLIKVQKVSKKSNSKRQKVITNSNKKAPSKTFISRERKLRESVSLNLSPRAVREDINIPEPAAETNLVAKNKSSLPVVNPLKGKNIVKNKALPPANTSLLQEPSTSQGHQSIGLPHTNSRIDDSGYMSFETGTSSVLCDFNINSTEQPLSSLRCSPTENEFRETLIYRQNSELQLQSTPQTNVSTTCSSKLTPKSLLF